MPIVRKKYSYEVEADYYSTRWPTSAQGYTGLAPYLTAWLGGSTESTFSGKLVLDIGAGEATYSRLIAESYKPSLVIALDLFHRRLAPAAMNSNLQNFTAVAGDCLQLPFKDSSFDVVFGSLVLHQIGNLDGVLSEIRRVLRPGGVYVGIEPNIWNPIILWRHLFGEHSKNQYLLRKSTLNHVERIGFDIGVRYFYWKRPGVRSIFFTTCIGLMLSKKNIEISDETARFRKAIVIPRGKRHQLIYRADLKERVADESPQVGAICVARNPFQAVSFLVQWVRTYGFIEGVRIALKLTFGSRILAVILVGPEIAAYAWLYPGSLCVYPTDKNDVAIALVSTRTFFRGKGLARVLIKRLYNVAAQMGHAALFIETAADNQRMIKVIEGVGRWDLVGTFLRLGCRFE
jgi:SAM-dependent methyltransferase/GNAT superfamily N-acetyltransferase